MSICSFVYLPRCLLPPCLHPAATRQQLPRRCQAPARAIVEQTETDRLNVWLDEQYEQQLDFSPQTRSVLGDKTAYDQLNDVTLEAQQRRLDWQRQSVAAMRSEFEYQALNEDGKLSLICGNTRWNRPKQPIPIAITVTFLGVVAPMHHCPVS